MTEPIIGNIDVAQIALYAFWIFFAGLIYYLQRENMREGFPPVSESGDPAANTGLWPMPEPKTFRLPHGQGEVTVPMIERDRDVALRQCEPWAGSPFEPTGDPLADGVGPASWAPRSDRPDLTAEGEPRIRPLRALGGFSLAVPRNDPRGLPVLDPEDGLIGTVKDLWVDQGEQLIRYIEIQLPEEGGSRLLPMTLARLNRARVRVHSLFAHQVAGVPTTKADDIVTLLEEEKISAYWCGGKLYAGGRLEPAL